MASIIDQIQDELTCTICFNTLNDAMTLECGHHNCCQCVQELIRQSTQNGERYAKCPQCRERIHPSKIKADNTLRNIKSIITQTNQDVLMCEKHLKRMVIFCEDDRVMICWLCGINDHRSHYLRPLQEAADSYKTKLNEFQHQFKQRIDVLNGQILVKRKAIELETSKKQPNSQKIGNAVLEEKKLQEQVDSLTDLSTVVQKKCEEELHVFLQDITDLLARCQMARDGIGSDIVDLVKYFQVNVKFDPNTAHMSLSVSKDLMSVRWKERWNNIEQQDNFQKDPCILGSVTIKSGKISWLLKIGKTRYFSFGWAKKSLDKTEKLTLKPEEGIWALSVGADGMKALDDPPVQVCCNSTLNKVWVYLDYDAGHLSFYNDSQNPLFRKTGLDLLYAFSHRFDEPVRPFFWIRNQDHDLTLLPP